MKKNIAKPSKNKLLEINLFLPLSEMWLMQSHNVALNITINFTTRNTKCLLLNITKNDSSKNSRKKLRCTFIITKDFPRKLLSRWCWRCWKYIDWSPVHLQAWKNVKKSRLFEGIESCKNLSPIGTKKFCRLTSSLTIGLLGRTLPQRVWQQLEEHSPTYLQTYCFCSQTRHCLIRARNLSNGWSASWQR